MTTTTILGMTSYSPQYTSQCRSLVSATREYSLRCWTFDVFRTTRIQKCPNEVTVDVADLLVSVQAYEPNNPPHILM